MEMGLDVPDVVRFQKQFEEKMRDQIKPSLSHNRNNWQRLWRELEKRCAKMMDKMIFGRYVPADSILHRMDPRSKLIIIFLVCMYCLFCK